MPVYGLKSSNNLRTCTQTIQTVFNIAITYYDITILQGHRPQAEQWETFLKGRKLIPGRPADSKNPDDYQVTGRYVTKVDGYKVKSMHNYEPSKAVDAAPYPIDFWAKEQAAIDRFLLLSKGKGKLDNLDVLDLIRLTDRLAKIQARFYYFAGRILQIADQCYREGKTKELLRWGGDWDKDHDFTDQNFDDLPHFETYTPKQ